LRGRCASVGNRDGGRVPVPQRRVADCRRRGRLATGRAGDAGTGRGLVRIHRLELRRPGHPLGHMIKLILLSILVATVVMPSLAARDQSHFGGLKKLLVAMFVFSLFYWVVVMFLVPEP